MKPDDEKAQPEPLADVTAAVPLVRELLGMPPAAPTIAAEGVPSVDTPEFWKLANAWGGADQFKPRTEQAAALIAHLNADKAMHGQKELEKGFLAGVEAAEAKVRELGVNLAKFMALSDAQLHLLESRNRRDERSAQEAAKPSEGSGDVPPPFTISRWTDTKQRGLLLIFDERPSDAQVEYVRAALAQPAETVGGDVVDAGRYRFLRNCEKDITADNGIPWCVHLIREHGIPTSVALKGTALDLAIDKARTDSAKGSAQ